MAYWACHSCPSFAQKVNAQFRGVTENRGSGEPHCQKGQHSQKYEYYDQIGEEITEDGEWRKRENIEEAFYEELKERSPLLHGVEEPEERITDNRERTEKDKESCGIYSKQ
jgi:hypothetical protein